MLTGVIGTLASFGMFLAIGNWQDHLAEVRFVGVARDHLQTLNAGLKDATDLLYSMRAYFESLEHPATQSEYQAFSHSLRNRVAGLRDTGWAPRMRPSVSLTALKRSRSRERMAISWPPSASRRSTARCSRNAIRFGRPVNASCRAR